ncbi:phytanoyl-CoA dioxygenase family protein [Aquihabitans sp. McL0605]|uniref:phytanoyl-CoA dioxygenase family protein n=1 Tax=Aquihabitans sp. McL0605 TaxID=3415671 RepID=UPI003CE7FA72
MILAPPSSSAIRSVGFRDPALADRFAIDGFLCVPFLGAAAVDELRRLWDEVGRDDLTGIYSNVHDLDVEANRRVDRIITGAFSGPAQALFQGARLGGSSFLVKGVGPDSASTPHQDWNNVDEHQAISLSIWCPLVDVDAHNGALVVVPGSHRLRPSIRSLDTPSLYLDFDPDLDQHLVEVPARAGDAVIYAHNLFHGSKPNRSDRIRVSAVSGVLPADAPSIHHRAVPGAPAGTFEVLEVERDFYFGGIAAMKDGVLPPTARPTGTVLVPDHELRPDEVVAAAVEWARTTNAGPT